MGPRLSTPESSPSVSVEGTSYPIDARAHTVHDIPARLRPREEFERLGVRHVSDDVLLAIVLRGGVRGMNVVQLARRLLLEFGSLNGLAAASPDELQAVPGIGRVKAQVLAAALEVARRLEQEKTPPRYRVRTPEDAARLLREDARALDHEVFWVLLLDTKHQLRGRPVDVTKGLLDASLVHPREVFREAVRAACAAVVLVHNHPSGDPTPSAEDIRITRQLVEAGRIVDIRVLDHVIVGRSTGDAARDHVSLRETGIVSFGA